MPLRLWDRAAAAAAIALALPLPAWACGTCGCGLPGSNSELESMANPASLGATAGRFMIQTTLSARDITGSFNELGTWTPKPNGSSLDTVQANLTLSYFPTDRITVGVLVPTALNRLDQAQWGPLGSVAPASVDADDNPIPTRTGGGVGDVALQASYVVALAEGPWPALSAWGSVMLPTGNAQGNPAEFTGAGVANAQLGLSVVETLGPWELSGSLGFQRPLSTPSEVTAFYVGTAWVGTLQGTWEVVPGWRLGLGASGFQGLVDGATSASAARTAKLKLLPSLEWRFLEDNALRLAYGSDPGLGPWSNAMTDQTLVLTFTRLI